MIFLKVDINIESMFLNVLQSL